MTTDALILQVTDSATIIRTTDTLVTALGSNVAGPTGPTGPTGPAGTAATVSVGSTTTGAAGSSAAVSNTGTTSAAVLNFTIPKGDTGATGPAGDKFKTTSTSSITLGTGTKSFTVGTGLAWSANQGIVVSLTLNNYMVGTVTSYDSSTGAMVAEMTTLVGSGSGTGPWTVNLDGVSGPSGPPGSAATVSVGSTTTGAAGSSASVNNTGTSSAAVLNFTIPKGDQGTQGPSGAAATVSVGSTTTGAAGTSASVSNTGTTSAAVLAFTIPQGATGATGSFNANSAFQGALEQMSIDSSTTLNGSNAATISIKTAGAYLFTTNPGANWTTNVRGDGSTTLASMLSVGQSVTVTVMTNNGASAYYCPSGSFQIDGTATGVTMKWLNGATPAAGDASAYDIYTYTIVKTAATPTYTVFAALTKFA